MCNKLNMYQNISNFYSHLQSSIYYASSVAVTLYFNFSSSKIKINSVFILVLYK